MGKFDIDRPIAELFSVEPYALRIRNVCNSHDIATIRELCQHSNWDLLHFRHLGERSIVHIEDMLGKFGLRLGMTEEDLDAYMLSLIHIYTYETPPQIIWIDNSTIATLGNFSASTGKAKSKKTFNVSALVAASLAGKQVLNYRAHLPEGKRRILYVDTEQSRYHCHTVLERILRLAGLPTTADSENLDFICLREMCIRDRFSSLPLESIALYISSALKPSDR